MLVVRRIHVTYHLTVDAEADREAIDRVMGFHQRKCPVARTLEGCVDITTEMVLHEE